MRDKDSVWSTRSVNKTGISIHRFFLASLTDEESVFTDTRHSTHQLSLTERQTHKSYASLSFSHLKFVKIHLRRKTHIIIISFLLSTESRLTRIEEQEPTQLNLQLCCCVVVNNICIQRSSRFQNLI